MDGSCGDSPSIDWLLAAAATEMSASGAQQQDSGSEGLRRCTPADNDKAAEQEPVMAGEMLPPPPPQRTSKASTASMPDQTDDDGTSPAEQQWDDSTRLSRSASSASRNPNRLSLTLPIAPPNSGPTRPTPSSASTISSYPPTPIEYNHVHHSGMAGGPLSSAGSFATTTPQDPNDFIIAIAAQERRVLELREELGRAEAELGRLKKHFTVHEAHKKRHELRKVEPLRPLARAGTFGVNGGGGVDGSGNGAGTAVAAETPEHDDASSSGRRSVEMERRRSLMLLSQGGNSSSSAAAHGISAAAPGTPGGAAEGRGRRRVIRGGHTRTLSLLSPTKDRAVDGTGTPLAAAVGGFSIHEDAADLDVRGGGVLRSPADADSAVFQSRSGFTPSSAAALSKRASWNPRTSYHGGTTSSSSSSAGFGGIVGVGAASGVRQFAEDFRQGLWTFVEDIRQATVGDEPITGGGGGAASNHHHHQAGTPSRSSFDSAAASRLVRYASAGSAADGGGADQDTIRAPAQPRQRASAALFEQQPGDDGSSASASAANALGPRANNNNTTTTARGGRATKHFSWAPLTFDAFDDSSDWSNWDSPTVKSPSPRWSGSTAQGSESGESGGGGGAAKADGEKNKTPLRISTSATGPDSDAVLLSGPARLEDLSLSVLNRLTPSGLKKTAAELMREWERSLSPSTASPSASPSSRLEPLDELPKELLPMKADAAAVAEAVENVVV